MPTELLKIMDPLVRVCEGLLVADQIIVVLITLLESNNFHFKVAYSLNTKLELHFLERFGCHLNSKVCCSSTVTFPI